MPNSIFLKTNLNKPCSVEDGHLSMQLCILLEIEFFLIDSSTKFEFLTCGACLVSSNRFQLARLCGALSNKP